MTPALGNPGASVPLGLRFATERSTSGSVVGPEPAWLGTGNWEDDRSVSDTNDHDLTWRTGHVALAVDHMAGHLEALTFVHLDALGPAGTELEREVSLQHLADRHVLTVVVPPRHRLWSCLRVLEVVAP